VSAGDADAGVDAGDGAGDGTLLLIADDLGLDGGSGAGDGRVPREGMLPREGGCAPPLGGDFGPPLLGPPETGFLTLLKLRLERVEFFLSIIDFLLDMK
jgi:hypothetical protein